MKKTVRPIVLLPAIPIASLIGFLLRLWTLGDGPDSVGLYAPHIYVWCFLLILTFAVMAGVILLVMPLQRNGQYPDHFPASLPAAISCGVCALAVALCAFRLFSENGGLLGILALLTGLGAAVCFGLSGLARYQGKQPEFWVYAVICLFLALRLFLCCRSWSTLTQAGTYLFPFAASAFSLLGIYHLCAYSLNMGNRRHSLLFSLISVYLCVVALPASEDTLLYAALAVFFYFHLCRLGPIRPRHTESN